MRRAQRFDVDGRDWMKFRTVVCFVEDLLSKDLVCVNLLAIWFEIALPESIYVFVSSSFISEGSWVVRMNLDCLLIKDNFCP